MTDSLHQRGKALEDSFFRLKDCQLLERLRQEMEARSAIDSLKSASGISDPETLEGLVEHQVTAETMTSLAMVPLVVIAWADDKLSPDEKRAILKAAHQAGIEEGTAAHQLLDSWLSEKPDEDLWEAWKQYVHALKEQMSSAPFNQLKQTILRRAKEIAKVAGGILGTTVGAISIYEEKKLKELEEVFGD